MLIYVKHAFEHFNVSKPWPYTVLCTFFHIVHVALFRCICIHTFLYRCIITCISIYAQLSCHTFYRLWFCGISSTTINCGPQNGGCKATMSTERPKNFTSWPELANTMCQNLHQHFFGGDEHPLAIAFGVHQGTIATWRNRKSNSLKPKDLAYESRVSCTGSLPCKIFDVWPVWCVLNWILF